MVNHLPVLVALPLCLSVSRDVGPHQSERVGGGLEWDPGPERRGGPTSGAEFHRATRQPRDAGRPSPGRGLDRPGLSPDVAAVGR